ncbi:hypothetical protein L7F22_006108 [Adiantum nelumboides]|nr:hypothetical protein [Adiantum nelumboides]
MAALHCSISDFYVKPRSLDWWNHYVAAVRGDDRRFKEKFRLLMPLFQHLSHLFWEKLQQGAIPTSLARVNGRILPVEKQIAVALLRLASGARLIDISEHFGVALDVTHVNMEKPKCESSVDWFDRNKNYSMSVQCIVDMDLRFMDVFAGT